MEHGVRPYRSVLYLPASTPRALDKARDIPAVSVLPSERARTRALAVEAVGAPPAQAMRGAAR